MPKHNVDAIAHAAIAAQAAYEHHAAGKDGQPEIAPTPELLAEVRVRVLSELHERPATKEAPSLTTEQRRANRLFSAVVRALTVRGL